MTETTLKPVERVVEISAPQMTQALNTILLNMNEWIDAGFTTARVLIPDKKALDLVLEWIQWRSQFPD